MNLKQQKLAKLRGRIIDEIYKKRWEEVWFFPECPEVSGVKGYMGTDPIIFIAINPSFGAFPSEQDKFYYKELRKLRLGNAHLTDLFKIKTENKFVEDLLQNRTTLQEAEKYLGEEIKIIKPKLIVPVGISYKKLYERTLKQFGIPIADPIPHYAPRFNNKEKEEKFRNALRSVRVNM